MAQLSDNEIRLLKTDWPIVAMFGQSGTGRSTFINLIAQEQQQVGEDIDSCTDKVTFVEARIRGKPVVVVDTPGIDDTRPGMTEADVLANIAQCLEFTGRKRRWVTAVLYLYRITDPRFTPTASRIAIMLRKICGDKEMTRIMFCTTMWDLPPPDESKRRHAQLCNAPDLKVMISGGARTAMHSSRWNNAKMNAEKILSDLIEDQRPGPLAIQNEIIDQAKAVADTGAGQLLTRHIQAERTKTDREIRDLQRLMSAESGVGAANFAEELAAQERMKAELERQQEVLSKETKCLCIIC